jgi:hypothetical protein
VNKRPGLSRTEVDDDAILLRAYGKGTDVLIDRESKSTPLSMAAPKTKHAQRKPARTRSSRATTSLPLSTLGLKMVSYTSSFRAAYVHPPICDGQKYGEG